MQPELACLTETSLSLLLALCIIGGAFIGLVAALYYGSKHDATNRLSEPDNAQRSEAADTRRQGAQVSAEASTEIGAE